MGGPTETGSKKGVITSTGLIAQILEKNKPKEGLLAKITTLFQRRSIRKIQCDPETTIMQRASNNENP
ncbi:uncharacterized protein G2W53_026874 [Senna tora]|uniref:Uncharacterized protein n=1 Tax=Senna tora TaxID=362788 RepID=A0A834WLS1_9FABA|nr:uncharacterized protein G2W53_026874 [Senna tora]